MFSNRTNQFTQQETTCNLLLKELQKIWDEVGESDTQRDEMLLEIEQKCLELYGKKVDEAKRHRAQLQKAIADSEAEIADICSSMGEQPLHFDRKSSGSLKKGVEIVVSQLEEMRKVKTERKNLFLEVLYQLQNISGELYVCMGVNTCLDENNLSLKKLEELQRQLHELQNEKARRLKQVSDNLNTLQSLCSVLGLDFEHRICEIHPTMVNSTGTKDLSNRTIKNLTSEVESLREFKIQKMRKLQTLASALLEMWILMDTTVEEQQKFHNVTSKIAASESELTEPNMLSVEYINHVEAEVRRLEQLKSTKMKELVLRKKLELEKICRSTHLTTKAFFRSDHSIEFTDSEAVNLECLLEKIELEIARTKEDALSRKEILEKVDKWLAASQEESWLEEYNRDDNRYNAGRGAHLALKRAEKARTLVNKTPGMVEALSSKVTAWEKERGLEFWYDGRRLLSMLEEHVTLRQEKENERQRQRDQRRLQGQLMAERETLFGSKPSPSKSGKNASRCSTGVPSIRKFSVGGAMPQDPKPEKATLILHSNKKGSFSSQNSSILRKKNAGYATQSTGKATSRVVGHAVKKTTYSAVKETETEILSPLIRKPLSPVSSRVLSQLNMADFQEDQRRIQQNSQMLTGTPSKPFSVGDLENRTPKNKGIPVPTTPLTSAPMLTTTTPDTPRVYSGSPTTTANPAQPLEYSFEEVRAGFILPNTYGH